jgi:preprotein translocase subunit SecF
MKFLYLFDPHKPRDFLVRRGPLFVAIGFAFAMLNIILVPIAGINWGIDFQGGTEMQVRFAQPVKAEDIRKVLEDQGFHKNQVQQYGTTSTNEWLVRVERMTTLTDAKVQEVRGLVDAALGATVKIEFHAQEGDRFVVIADQPKIEGDVLALTRALDDQQAKIAAVVEEKGGLRLRRTRATESAAETTADAIVRDEPYQGKVKYLVQLQGVSDKVSKALGAALGDVEVRRVDFVDATVAQQLKTDGVLALIISLLLILVYVAVRFDIYFAPGALIALIHDPIGALCVYTIGRMDFDLPSIAAMLTVIGYSINNTIVIYDRVRETMPVSATPLSIETVTIAVTNAVNSTLNRTVNSTLTVLFTTVSVWFFTEGAVRTFAACLTVGILIGAYSSILMAPAIYLFFRKNFLDPAAASATTSSGPTREDRERGIV